MTGLALAGPAFHALPAHAKPGAGPRRRRPRRPRRTRTRQASAATSPPSAAAPTSASSRPPDPGFAVEAQRQGAWTGDGGVRGARRARGPALARSCGVSHHGVSPATVLARGPGGGRRVTVRRGSARITAFHRRPARCARRASHDLLGVAVTESRRRLNLRSQRLDRLKRPRRARRHRPGSRQTARRTARTPSRCDGFAAVSPSFGPQLTTVAAGRPVGDVGSLPDLGEEVAPADHLARPARRVRGADRRFSRRASSSGTPASAAREGLRRPRMISPRRRADSLWSRAASTLGPADAASPPDSSGDGRARRPPARSRRRPRRGRGPSWGHRRRR